MTGKTFYVFAGSTKGMMWHVKDRNKLYQEAFSIQASVWNRENTSKIADLDVVRQSLGKYHTTINTNACGLSPGSYIVKLECLVDGNDYVQLDVLRVEATV